VGPDGGRHHIDDDDRAEGQGHGGEAVGSSYENGDREDEP